MFKVFRKFHTTPPDPISKHKKSFIPVKFLCVFCIEISLSLVSYTIYCSNENYEEIRNILKCLCNRDS